MTSLSVLIEQELKHQSISANPNRDWQNDNVFFLELRKEVRGMKKHV